MMDVSADCQLGYCGTCNDCGHKCHDPYREESAPSEATATHESIDWEATANMWQQRAEVQRAELDAALNRERVLLEGARGMQRTLTRQAADIHRLNNKEEA